MTDELKYEGFARNVEHEYLELFPNEREGYEAWDIMQRLQVYLPKVPEEFRKEAELAYPDEDGSAWGIRWRRPETDDEYANRYHEWKAREERSAAEIRRRITQWADVYYPSERKSLQARWHAASTALEFAQINLEAARLRLRCAENGVHYEEFGWT